MYTRYKVRKLKTVYKILFSVLLIIAISLVASITSDYIASLELGELATVRLNMMVLMVLMLCEACGMFYIMDYKQVKTSYYFK